MEVWTHRWLTCISVDRPVVSVLERQDVEVFSVCPVCCNVLVGYTCLHEWVRRVGTGRERGRVGKQNTKEGASSLELLSSHGYFVYYESLKRALKTKTIYGHRCDERLKTNVEESTRLTCTPLCEELEHLKIETRLTSETPVSEMGEYASVM